MKDLISTVAAAQEAGADEDEMRRAAAGVILREIRQMDEDEFVKVLKSAAICKNRDKNGKTVAANRMEIILEFYHS